VSESDADTTQRPSHLASEADLDAFIAAHDVALVEFYTEGCGICASMEPVLGVVAKQADAGVALVNPRDDPPLLDRFDVRSVPLLVVFVDGEPVARRAEGFVGADEVVEWIEAESS
jgi:thioredoxin 1